MRKPLLIVLCCGIGMQSFAQISWPVISREAKPWTRWWWEGSAVNQPDLTANMQKYHDAGLGGLEITPIYGIKGQESKFIQYLSPQWISMLNFTIQEGKRLGLGIDMANATGWPFGGPWIDDESSSKNMEMEAYTVKGGGSLNQPIIHMQQAMVTAEGKAPAITDIQQPLAANKNLQAWALGQVRFPKLLPLQALMGYGPDGQIVNLTAKVDANGKLNWTAPKGGDWALYGIFMGWHGKLVERAAPGGEGFVIDHFSQPALKTYLDKFDQAFKAGNVTGIRSFFNDSYEVDDARGQSNFTPELFAEFKKRRGYDLLEHLPALFSKENKDYSRVVCDYRETISDMLLDNFTIPWHTWAAGHGALIRNQSHGSPSNILDLYSAIDIPETEGVEPLRFRFATSAAHVTGKQLASSESATWLGDHFTSSLSDVKTSIDRYFLGGVNHVFYHGIAYSPPSAPWPGWLFYASVHLTPADPQWNDFHALNEYIARSQSFLQEGKPNNDVLLYYPIFDSFSEPGRSLLKHYDAMRPEFIGSGFEACAQLMLDKGYTFDYISDKQILNTTAAGKEIKTSGGAAYQTIILPDCHFIPLATFSKLADLARSGAHIIIYKNAPADVPGLGNLDANRKALKDLLATLKFTDVAAGIKKADIGKGAFLIGEDAAKLLSYSKVRAEQMVESALQFNRRKYDGGTSYFVVNKGINKIDGWVPLTASATSVTVFNAMTATAGLAQTKTSPQGDTEVYLQLAPGESAILKTSSTLVKGEAYAYYKPSVKATEIKGDWAVSFVNGGPELPAAVTKTDLVSWTDFGGDELKRFSGTAKYAISFAKPANVAKAFKLDLGKVYHTADVYLNGTKLATLIGPDYSVIIPAALLKTDNKLEVTVSNLMANRISDMDRRNIPYRIFYNTNFPARSRDARGEDGLFNAARWEPKPSGLLGPVKLEAVEYLKF
ncbi:glycoside hydrolase family 2 protein [Mucilaginibacter sp. HMF5004]|uniref:glycosyl hydrolase n=1 Tax=Mucilaginibacter rivuli TaxID=2857527 RepID=UPI001C604C36|nr:glycosyl hydrolase [Mucilaginibacter rivuli]MBW4889136.1 glycoside hydrolase family 2 protein [Mucilaginibacter rivuli]